MQHINTNNPKQSVYKSGHSTKAALLHTKNEIHLSLPSGEPTALVLLDLLAIFNTTDHTTLLNCLNSWFGVCGRTLKWFMFYLSHPISKQLKLCKLLFGVPQGSVIGSLLFFLYTTPLSKVIGMQPDIKIPLSSSLFICLKKCSPSF